MNNIKELAMIFGTPLPETCKRLQWKFDYRHVWYEHSIYTILTPEPNSKQKMLNHSNNQIIYADRSFLDKVLCVCGGLLALTVGIALKPNRITAVDFSTSAAIAQNTCYAQCFLSNNLKTE